jgi:hypothetical protein
MVYNSSYTQSIVYTRNKGEKEREREMAPPNRMSLRPGLLWLTPNLVLIIQCYHEIVHKETLWF